MLMAEKKFAASVPTPLIDHPFISRILIAILLAQECQTFPSTKTCNLVCIFCHILLTIWTETKHMYLLD